MDKKDNILFKDLNLAFVYISILVIGLFIVFLMTTYINNKVSEFESSTTHQYLNN